MTLTVAVGELTRVLPWSLRALGYPFGTADRAARLVATAAALDPRVLDQIAEAGQRPEKGAQILRGPDGLKVEANGGSLFETGAVVIDYLAAQADAVPVVTAEVTYATHIELLAAVLLTGANYGLTCVVLRPESLGGGWLAAVSHSTGPRIHEGADRQALFAGMGHSEFAERIRDANTARGLVFVATEQPTEISFSSPGADVAAALAAANSLGIPVSERTLKLLFELEMKTWAPTSERSRAQAGFNPKTTVVS